MQLALAKLAFGHHIGVALAERGLASSLTSSAPSSSQNGKLLVAERENPL